jgi:hypothetical protein
MAAGEPFEFWSDDSGRRIQHGRQSRDQYIERSGGFLENGYSEWLRLYGFAPVARPVYTDLSDLIRSNPPASDSFAGKLRVNFMVVVRRENSMKLTHPLLLNAKPQDKP